MQFSLPLLLCSGQKGMQSLKDKLFEPMTYSELKQRSNKVFRT